MKVCERGVLSAFAKEPVCARYLPQLCTFIEEKLEAWMGLEINREKTRVVDLREKGTHLDFLGYTCGISAICGGGNGGT